MSTSTPEYRVVLSRAGINSCDNFFNPERAVARAKNLQKQGDVRIQMRTVTEWKDVSPGQIQNDNG